MIEQLDAPSARPESVPEPMQTSPAPGPSSSACSSPPDESPSPRFPSRTTVAARHARSFALPLMWFVIATVATYDCYATVKYFKSLPQLELNPVGRWLMDLGGPGWDTSVDQLAVFLACKVAGTIAVLFALQTIERVWRRWSLTITSSIASAQVALGVFLLA